MKLIYSLSKEDHLQYQLYAASKKTSVRKKRNRSRWLVPIIYFVLILFMLPIGSSTHSTAVGFGVLAILWYLFYPVYSKKKYHHHYKSYIDESYKDRIGVESTLEIKEGFLVSEDKTGEYKTRIDQITEIIEIGTHYFIKLTTGQSFIIPKTISSPTGNADAFVEQLISEYNRPLSKELDWEWE